MKVTSIPQWRADRERQEALFAEYFQGEYPANTHTALAEDGLDGGLWFWVRGSPSG